MKHSILKTNTVLAFAMAGMLAAGAVMAEKPSWAGAGKGGKEDRSDRRDDRRDEQRADRRDNDDHARGGKGGGADDRRGRFEERHRTIVHDYYASEFRKGRCPPGLAKKHNGCMPPGQAKKWQVGRALPREVVYYAVPQPLVVQIGPPPSGYRYVRVDSDILLLAIGTGIVIDAIQGLNR